MVIGGARRFAGVVGRSLTQHPPPMLLAHFVGDASLSPTRFAKGRNY
jgi:hypothetical protein